MTIYFKRKDKDYQRRKKIGRRLLIFKDGRNTRKLKDYKFKARDEDYIYV